MSAREMAINNNYEYRENKTEIYIDKITDELGNIDFFISIDKINKEITLYFDKEDGSSSDKTTLNIFELTLINKIREELHWEE